MVPGIAAVLLAASLFSVVTSQVAVAGKDEAAQKYKFQELPIAFPAGYDAVPKATVRVVNPAYEHIKAWVSSVGAGIALNDFTGHGKANSLCIVDTRTNQVVVTYAPTAPAADQFAPFVLNPAPLPIDNTMAPMGCTPGDFNLDGRMDLLVTYWGRVPIMFLAKTGVTTLSNDAYCPEELTPQASPDGKYHGPRWNTNAVAVNDFDGDGKPDIIIGNYFPDSDVLDPTGLYNVSMNNGLSTARNGGGSHVMRWLKATSGDMPTATFVEDHDAIPYEVSTGWTLAISSADLTGRGVPEVYVANDFGHDHLLHNISTPGRIRFTPVIGERTPTTPKSFVLGLDSFKGMGVDFGDINRKGRFDMVVSNITTSWGLEESNFAFMNDATDNAKMLAELDRGVAPFTQKARPMGLAWTGWGWDVKFGDFLNNGNLDVVQTEGFVKGDINRWPWLQELAMTNDNMLSNPGMWPKAGPGDDLAGSQPIAFYAKNSDGVYVNIAEQLGLAVPIPTRGVATADTTGTGTLDFAIARQWGPPAFYANKSPNLGRSLDLRLYRPATQTAGTAAGAPTSLGVPAYGATVMVKLPDGTCQITQVDGGGGHGGKRSFEVHVGLGGVSGPVDVEIQWRDLNGTLRKSSQKLTAGTHTQVLTDTAQEVENR
ncbi:RNA-binding protein [Longispora fulva]|uniref:CRTAC1 family protein n=1 Tax=Longispora fulva TaxID=619741 RepID=UPI001A4FBB41|nr:RNA-binding protein [Longispora fulva]